MKMINRDDIHARTVDRAPRRDSAVAPRRRRDREGQVIYGVFVDAVEALLA